MRFMVFVRADQQSESGAMPREEDFAAMGQFNEELVKAGVMLAGEGLQRSAEGVRIVWKNGTAQAIDGPFPASELVCGFWMIEVETRAEALDWMRRAPFPDGAVLELRKVLEAEDFGGALSPELREAEERLRTRIGEMR
jgi:hypothetical protein